MDTILRSLCLLPNLRVYWRTTYQIGYDAGRWDGRGKVDDADEKAKVISRWGEKRPALLLPNPYGYDMPRKRTVGKKSRPRLTWSAAHAIGYDEGNSDTVVGITGDSLKSQSNFETGLFRSRPLSKPAKRERTERGKIGTADAFEQNNLTCFLTNRFPDRIQPERPWPSQQQGRIINAPTRRKNRHRHRRQPRHRR